MANSATTTCTSRGIRKGAAAMGSGCWDGTSITWSRTISHTVAVIPTWWKELKTATSSDTILVSIQTTIQTAGYQPSATTATSIRISSPTDRIHVSASTRATLARELIAISCMAVLADIQIT